MPRPRNPNKGKPIPIVMAESEISAAEALALFTKRTRSKAIISGFFRAMELQAVEMLIHSKPGTVAVRQQMEKAGHPVREPLDVLGPFVELLAKWAEQNTPTGAATLRRGLEVIAESRKEVADEPRR